MGDVQEAVASLVDAGAFVLSPADPRVVDQFGDFVFVASDRVRHIRSVQGRHLAAIAASDFVWLVAPDGYVGQSAAMEIGYASALDIPVLSNEVPTDLTLRQWVTVVAGPEYAAQRARAAAAERPPRRTDVSLGRVLLEPATAIEASHDDLLIAQRGLVGAPGVAETDAAQAALRRIHLRTAVA